MAKGVRPRKSQSNPPYSKVNAQGCVLDLLQGHPKKPGLIIEKDNLDVTKKFEQKVREMKQPVSNIGPIISTRTKGADPEDELDARGFTVNSDSEKEEAELDAEDYDCGEEEASDMGDQVSLGSSYDSGGEEEDEDSDGGYYELRNERSKSRIWNNRVAQKKPPFICHSLREEEFLPE